MGYPKGYTMAGKYRTKKGANNRAKKLRGKFNSVRVIKGTSGTAWGKSKVCYRVWVK